MGKTKNTNPTKDKNKMDLYTSLTGGLVDCSNCVYYDVKGKPMCLENMTYYFYTRKKPNGDETVMLIFCSNHKPRR